MPESRSKQKRLAKNKSEAGVIILSKETLVDGKQYWAFISMAPNRYDEYKVIRNIRKFFSPGSSDTILDWGIGENPPEYVIERMKKFYGFRPDHQDNEKD